MIKHILYLLSVISITNLEAAIERRAAFDFGSGKIKVQVADVDTESQEIKADLYQNSIRILLAEDLAHQEDGNFSEKIKEEAFAAAAILKKEAASHGAIQFAGIATEAYRTASNGAQLLDRFQKELTIPISLISQEEEGKFAFLSLVEEKGFAPENLICWDIGGGSFQITYLDATGTLKVYKGPFGRSTTKNGIIANIKHQSPLEIATPNPMNEDEWKSGVDYLKSVLPPMPEELIKKLKEPQVQLIAVSGHPEKLRVLGTYRDEDLLQLLSERLGKTDEELSLTVAQPRSAVSELILIHTLMEMMDVHQVNYVATKSGSTSGLLISEEYWKNFLK